MSFYDVDARNRICDLAYPPTGTIGYACLIQSPLIQTVVTLNVSTDIFTTTNPNPGYITGTRIRMAVETGGTFPSVDSGDPISTGIDYFCIKISNNEFQIARSLAQALSSTPITFNSAGTGVQSFTEQLLTFNDPLNVIVNREVSHSNYFRYQLNSVGNAIAGQKTISWAQPVTSGNGQLVYRHKLVIIGGSSTPGDSTGNKDVFATESGNITINEGQTATLGITFKVVNV